HAYPRGGGRRWSLSPVRGADGILSASTPELSIVVPVFDEEDAVEPLVRELTAVLDGLGRPAEIICVDDGSTDASFPRLRALAVREPRLTVLRLARYYGPMPALQASIADARAPLLV